jgi:hypothetical protein
MLPEWSDNDLLRSLRAIGPLLPVFVWRGQIFDGHRRRRLCHSQRVRIETRVVTDEEAPRLLWVLAPDRALDRWNDLSVVEQARLFETEPSQVAKLQRKLKALADPPPPLRPRPIYQDGEVGRFNLKLPAKKLEELRARARKRNVSLSEYVRELL